MGIDKDIEIEIISDDDDSLKNLGELLANKTSRDLLKFLMQNETYKMKISDETKVPFSLVEHHLKKMEKLGLVKIKSKKIVKGGIMHKTYKITATGIFILLNNTKEEIKGNITLKKIFKESVKFASVGIAAIAAWFGSFRPNKIIIDRTSDTPENITLLSEFISMINFYSIPIIVTSIIIGCGLFLIYSKK